MKKTVLNVSAPAPRMTRTAVVCAAVMLSVPVFLLLSLADWLWL